MGNKKPETIMKDFLVESRKKANLSQSEVAARSAVFGMGPVLDQRAVSRLEKQPLNSDPIKIAGYMSAIGIPTKRYYDLLESVLQPEQRNNMNFGKLKPPVERVTQATAHVDEVTEKLKKCDCPYLETTDVYRELENAKLALANLDRKPIIGFFGHFDAGKSTVINTIVNQDILPAQYAPATCIVNLLMHTDDRPELLQGQVALFRRGFFPHMINDPAAIEEYLIEEGDLSILDRLGVHSYDGSIGNDAYISIVFMDVELLRHVWLLDTPGDMNNSDEGSMDSDIALGGAELADGIVYLSSHNGFLNGDDEGLFVEILRKHPPLTPEAPTEHLRFIQSHCHSDILPEDIERVQDITFKRLKGKMEHLIFEHWKSNEAIQISPTPEELHARIQAFWREREELRQGTLECIQGLALYLIESQDLLTKMNIQKVFSQTKDAFSKAIMTLEARKKTTAQRVKEVQQQDARFRKESEFLLSEFSRLIDSCDVFRSEDKETMELFFDKKSDPDHLVDIIESLYDDKKEAQSGIGNYVAQLLTGKLESTLYRSGTQASDRLDALLGRWTSAMPSLKTDEVSRGNADVVVKDFSSFDARAAFIGGLTGIGSLGAMALYVSTIASNLGAYILVGKVAGVLVSLGLLGSVTTATSFVAAIGGPITIGITLAALISLAIYRLLGGSWQESLAKKVSKGLIESDAIENIYETIDRFWDNTKKALDAGLRELKTKTDEHLKALKMDAQIDYDPGLLQTSIASLKSVRDIVEVDNG